MKKQSSVQSNTSDGGRGNRERRNTTGKGGESYQAKGGQQAAGQKREPRAEPIKLSEDELKTKIQVIFNKFVKKEEATEEEAKTENEARFRLIKDLMLNGQMTTAEGDEKKVRAEDIIQAFTAKMIDMDQHVLEENINAFMAEWVA